MTNKIYTQEEINTILSLLPKNWKNIRLTLKTILEEGHITYQRYRPRGKAALHGKEYNETWDKLDVYARMCGLEISYVPGPRGGRWSSFWTLTRVGVCRRNFHD